MRKLVGIAAATAAVLAIAIGYQALGAPTTEQKDPPAATSTETPATDAGQREGFTEDNTGKPGENKG